MSFVVHVALFPFLFLLFLPPNAAGQACPDSVATGLLDGNSVAASVYNNGFLFWNGSGNTYRVPKEETASAIFNASLWIGGLVGGDNADFDGEKFYQIPAAAA